MGKATNPSPFAQMSSKKPSVGCQDVVPRPKQVKISMAQRPEIGGGIGMAVLFVALTACLGIFFAIKGRRRVIWRPETWKNVAAVELNQQVLSILSPSSLNTQLFKYRYIMIYDISIYQYIYIYILLYPTICLRVS